MMTRETAQQKALEDFAQRQMNKEQIVTSQDLGLIVQLGYF